MLNVFEAQGQTAVEGEREDEAAEDAGDGLQRGDLCQLEEAIQNVAEEHQEMVVASRGLPSTPTPPRSSRIRAIDR